MGETFSRALPASSLSRSFTMICAARLYKQAPRCSRSPPVAVLLVGLQGSGKTTTAGKLALHLRKKGRRPLLVPTDIYRPAAIDQLVKIGKQINIEAFTMAQMKTL